jgi:hypothetical protein
MKFLKKLTVSIFNWMVSLLIIILLICLMIYFTKLGGY